MDILENDVIFTLSPIEQLFKYMHLNNFSLAKRVEAGAIKILAERFEVDVDLGFKDVSLGSYLNPPVSLKLPEGKSLSITKGLRYMPPHVCDAKSVEFLYVYSGQCRLDSKHKVHIFQEGDLCIFPSFKRNSYILDNDRDIVFNLCVWPETFRSVFLNMINEANKLTTYLSYILFYDDNLDSSPSFITIRTGKAKTFSTLFREMWEEEIINDKYTDTAQVSLFNRICVEILRKHSNSILLPANLTTASTTDAILAYIERNAPITSLKETAEHFSYSTSHLCRLIKSSTGKTFNTILHAARLRRAAELLGSSDLSIEVISSSVGYESLNTFYRLFNKAHGMTPKEYRNRFSEKKKMIQQCILTEVAQTKA